MNMQHLPDRWGDDDRRAAWALGLLVLATAVFFVVMVYAPNTWINRDGRFYVNVNTTIVEDFGLRQEGFANSWYTRSLGWNRNLPWDWSNVALGSGGEFLPKHPWLMPVLSTPLFFALGLLGTLVFNLLLFGMMAAGFYRFTREYAGPVSAALAACTFLLGTAVHLYMYDYNIDVLILALFALALGALVARRGVAAGVLYGLCLVIKPTCLMLLPLPLLFLWESKDKQTLKWSLIGGAATLALAGGVNTWLFGRPWWSGYSRTLVTVGGQQQVFSHADAFGRPLSSGLKSVITGPFGLAGRHTLMLLALPGLVLLARRRWRYVAGALLTLLISVLVFAKFEYDGDRFHWPAIALLLPALAVTYDLLQKALARVPRPARPAMLAALLPVLAFLAALPHISIGGPAILVLLNLLMACVLVFTAVLIAQRLVPPALAVAAVTGLFLLPMARDVILHGGQHLLAVTLLLVALEAALRRKWAFAIAAGAAAMTWILYVALSGGVLIRKRSPALLMPLLIPLVALFWSASRFLVNWSRRKLLIVAGGLALILVIVGTVRLALITAEPFRIGTEKSMRQAKVKLGDIPCDFLPWEHMSWECSHLDRGHYNQVGLALPERVKVGGQARELLLIPTGLRAQDRTVTWNGVEAGGALVLHHAAPDYPEGAVEVTVFINGAEIDRFRTPEPPDRKVHDRRIDTSAYVGKEVELRLSVHSLGKSGAAVAVGGGWE
jgi:hypothetical protein